MASVTSSDDEEMQPLDRSSDSEGNYDADCGDTLITK